MKRADRDYSTPLKRRRVGVLESEVLLAVVASNGSAYSVGVTQRLAEAGTGAPTVGAIQTTMSRLQDKGWLDSRWGEPTPVKGGRRRRLYWITAAGVAALQEKGYTPGMDEKVRITIEIEVEKTTVAEVNALVGHRLIEVKHKLRDALTDPYGTAFVSPVLMKIGDREV